MKQPNHELSGRVLDLSSCFPDDKRLRLELCEIAGLIRELEKRYWEERDSNDFFQGMAGTTGVKTGQSVAKK